MLFVAFGADVIGGVPLDLLAAASALPLYKLLFGQNLHDLHRNIRPCLAHLFILFRQTETRQIVAQKIAYLIVLFKER